MINTSAVSQVGWSLNSRPQPWVAALVRVLPALVGAGLLTLYVRTLLPGAVGGDAGEMQYAGPLLALVHPTGMPLYVLLGAGWNALIPFGSVAWRMNLLAAVSGAATGAVTAWAVGRWTGRSWIGAATGASLGLGATFWGQAVLADKYAFTALMTALPVGLALVWTRSRKTGSTASADRWLFALCLACGLSLSHHRSLIPVVAGLGWLVWLAEGRALLTQRRRSLIGLALVVGPPLLLYAVGLPWLRSHDASPLSFQPSTLNEWLDYLLERHIIQNGVFNFAATETTNFVDRLAIYARTLLMDFTPLSALIGLLGLAALSVTAPRVGIPLTLTFIVVGGLAANYRDNERQFTYYLPSFVVLAYAYGDGLARVAKALVRIGGIRHRWIPLAIVIAISIVPLTDEVARAYTLRRADALVGQPLDIWRQDLKTGNMAERLAAGLEDLPANAVVVGDWEQITPLWYYQHVENRRSDLRLIYPVEQLDTVLGQAQPVCLARHVPIDTRWHPTNVGAFVCLQDQPAFAPSPAFQPLGVALNTREGEPTLELSGYRSAGQTFVAGQHTPLILAWRALGPERADYSISLRILTEGWQQVWATDIGAPVLGLYPTSKWALGELVSDYHELSIARDLAPGRYLWTVVVYRQLSDGTFLELRDAQGNTQVLGGTFDVLPR